MFNTAIKYWNQNCYKNIAGATKIPLSKNCNASIVFKVAVYEHGNEFDRTLSKFFLGMEDSLRKLSKNPINFEPLQSYMKAFNEAQGYKGKVSIALLKVNSTDKLEDEIKYLKRELANKFPRIYGLGSVQINDISFDDHIDEVVRDKESLIFNNVQVDSGLTCLENLIVHISNTPEEELVPDQTKDSVKLLKKAIDDFKKDTRDPKKLKNVKLKWFNLLVEDATVIGKTVERAKDELEGKKSGKDKKSGNPIVKIVVWIVIILIILIILDFNCCFHYLSEKTLR